MSAAITSTSTLNIPSWSHDDDSDMPSFSYYSPVMQKEHDPSLPWIPWSYFPTVIKNDGDGQTETKIEILLYMDEIYEDENDILEEAIRAMFVALDCRQTLKYLCTLPLGIPTRDHTLLHLPPTDYYCTCCTMNEYDHVVVHETFEELNRIYPRLNNST